MTLIIKEATVHESDLIYQIMLASFQEYSGKLTPPSGALHETVEHTMRTFEVGGGAVLAWEEGNAVGSARYKLVDDYMYIGRVSVLPEYRGRGICKALLRRVESIAQQQGIAESRVEVRLSIPENIAMYQKFKYEVVEQKFYPEGTDSWYVMRKILSDAMAE
ncbi:GNAT family N-acetyltransferase [Paenibacillus roseipurpureus]|uniref:GNAT family N-acetyltransferase n=1 Tax=Paenibacillus roseopurpureus TaxID=2918901 RepID=A0AA96LLK4_9BACL|nr:GNAT family N-acetyltransferase [Paenibacillus sp. MBLB1832]WNR44147.1 GNAT family N-acetyltransferase [Paenibacillus sp. MBLB1832]